METECIYVYPTTVKATNGRTGLLLESDIDIPKIHNLKIWADEYGSGTIQDAVIKAEPKKSTSGLYYEQKEVRMFSTRGESINYGESLAARLLAETSLSVGNKHLVAYKQDMFTEGMTNVVAGKHMYKMESDKAFNIHTMSLDERGVTVENPSGGAPLEGYLFMRPFVPEAASPPTSEMYAAVMIPATPCQIILEHTEAPTYQRNQVFDFGRYAPPEKGYRGKHYLKSRVVVKLEIPHRLEQDNEPSVHMQEFLPSSESVYNLLSYVVDGVAPGQPF